MFHTEVVGTSIVYLRMKSHMPSSNDWLLIVIKQEAEYRFRATAILFYILQKN